MGDPAPPVPFEHRGRVLLDVRSGTGTGTGTGTPFVLVHGLGLGRLVLGPLASLLARDGPVHVVEMPGFGRAPRPDHVLAVEEHGELLAAFLDSVGPAVLVGNSLGTQIVLEAARRTPRLVRRLVLIGVVTDPADRRPVRLGLRLAQDAVGEPPWTQAVVLREYLRCGARRYVATAPSMAAYPTESVAAEVAAPTLVVRGGRDPICRLPWARRVTAALGDGRLVQVPGAHHLVMHSHPAAVAAAIRGTA